MVYEREFPEAAFFWLRVFMTGLVRHRMDFTSLSLPINNSNASGN